MDLITYALCHKSTSSSIPQPSSDDNFDKYKIIHLNPVFSQPALGEDNLSFSDVENVYNIDFEVQLTQEDISRLSPLLDEGPDPVIQFNGVRLWPMGGFTDPSNVAYLIWSSTSINSLDGSPAISYLVLNIGDFSGMFANRTVEENAEDSSTSSSADENEALTSMTEITYDALKTLRDDGKLTPGMQYRIIDYETIITGSYNLSNFGMSGYLHNAGVPESHPFDVIVIADDESHLNENARAALREGDDYFASNAIGAWKLKYCLDNDQQTYAWANVNGKGVIFWMEDEFNNQVGYDFKNIRFLRYALKAAGTQGDYQPSQAGKLVYNAQTQPNRYGGPYQLIRALGDYMEDYDYINPYRHQYKKQYIADYDFSVGADIINTTQFEEPNATYLNTFDADWYYTFDYWDVNEGVHFDASLNTYQNALCRENYIEPETEYHVYYTQRTDNVLGLGGNVWEVNSVFIQGTYSNSKNNISDNKLRVHNWMNTFGGACFSHTFGNDCYGNIIGNKCYGNTLEEGCYGNILEENCYCNTFGCECYNNTLVNNCYNNTFGNNCYNNTLVNNCYSNTFGNGCYVNTFIGDTSRFNIFGDSCYQNIFAGDNNSNTFENGCCDNTFQMNCHYNIFGVYCSNNNLNKSCQYNTLQQYCTNNTFGASCVNNTFGNNCQYNVLESSCLGNAFEKNCSNNTLRQSCTNNTFGGSCQNNTLARSCGNNTFEYGCMRNSLGQSNTYNTFGKMCYDNTSGSNMRYLRCGDKVANISIGQSQYGNNSLVVKILESYDKTSAYATLITKTGYGQETVITTTDGGQTWTTVNMNANGVSF